MTSSVAYLDYHEITEPTWDSKVAHGIEPLNDPRWDGFVQQHPRASMFHSSPWLQALSRTYGYQPFAYTTSPFGEDLRNAIVFCRVDSWVTGRRLVSLPFSDHCEPLVDSVEDQDILTAALERELGRGGYRYLEIRPLEALEMVTPLCHATATYAFHQLDLGPSLDTIFRNFHRSSTQRKIRRAEREGLRYREGNTKDLLEDFFRLFTLTRKRQGLAPQSKRWFANLMECFGDALKIRAAFRGEQAIAAMITIRYKDTLTYKYGCSDSAFNHLGCMHLLFWNAIQEAKSSGLRILDFGRCNADQSGLITFKNRWGATQSVLAYSRYGASESSTHLFDLYGSKWKSKAVKSVLKHVSPRILPMIGQILYQHIA
ncbi:MAG: GNAT family N-acetyltransferase [Candidatus Sulfotelmatobacter sp.]|jgi:CelD/BcsL family acetyltransferase involved in cellulose biosynthesis